MNFRLFVLSVVLLALCSKADREVRDGGAYAGLIPGRVEPGAEKKGVHGSFSSGVHKASGHVNSRHGSLKTGVLQSGLNTGRHGYDSILTDLSANVEHVGSLDFQHNGSPSDEHGGSPAGGILGFFGGEHERYLSDARTGSLGGHSCSSIRGKACSHGGFRGFLGGYGVSVASGHAGSSGRQGGSSNDAYGPFFDGGHAGSFGDGLAALDGFKGLFGHVGINGGEQSVSLPVSHANGHGGQVSIGDKHVVPIGVHRASLRGDQETSLAGDSKVSLTGGYRASSSGGHRGFLMGGQRTSLSDGHGVSPSGGQEASLSVHRASPIGGHGASSVGHRASLSSHGASLSNGYGTSLSSGNVTSLSSGLKDSLSDSHSGIYDSSVSEHAGFNGGHSDTISNEYITSLGDGHGDSFGSSQSASFASGHIAPIADGLKSSFDGHGTYLSSRFKDSIGARHSNSLEGVETGPSLGGHNDFPSGSYVDSPRSGHNAALIRGLKVEHTSFGGDHPHFLAVGHFAFPDGRFTGYPSNGPVRIQFGSSTGSSNRGFLVPEPDQSLRDGSKTSPKNLHGGERGRFIASKLNDDYTEFSSRRRGGATSSVSFSMGPSRGTFSNFDPTSERGDDSSLRKDVPISSIGSGTGFDRKVVKDIVRVDYDDTVGRSHALGSSEGRHAIHGGHRVKEDTISGQGGSSAGGQHLALHIGREEALVSGHGGSTTDYSIGRKLGGRQILEGGHARHGFNKPGSSLAGGDLNSGHVSSIVDGLEDSFGGYTALGVLGGGLGSSVISGHRTSSANYKTAALETGRSGNIVVDGYGSSLGRFSVGEHEGAITSEYAGERTLARLPASITVKNHGSPTESYEF